MTKPTTYRVYLNEEEVSAMRRVCEATELGQSELLSKLVTAGIRAVVANGCRIALPLRFDVVEDSAVFREKKK